MIAILICGTVFGREAGSEQLIRITAQTEGAEVHFWVENLQMAEVTVTIEMELTHLRATTNLPHTATYPGLQKTRAFSLVNEPRGKKWNWAYTYYATFGSLRAAHDESYSYSLPYPAGASFRVSQGYHGEYSHFGPNEYAIDWKMPVGTPVHAAREGVVVGLKGDSDKGGADVKFDRDANFVLIQHADGTLGHYVHLMKGGNRVRLGQKVKAGDLISHSGNTGHSTGPHLHFSVFKARDGKTRQTLPVKYRTGESLAVTLQPGKSYQAIGSAPDVRLVDFQGVGGAGAGLEGR